MALYVIGMPGVGKTTLLNAVCGERWGSFEARVEANGMRWEDYGDGRVKLGDQEGTDGFTIGSGGGVLRWIAERRPERLVGEGIRFCEAEWFAGLRRLGYSLTVGMLTGSESLIRMRVAMRGRGPVGEPMDGVGLRVRRGAMCVDGRWVANGARPLEWLREWLGRHPVWGVVA